MSTKTTCALKRLALWGGALTAVASLGACTTPEGAGQTFAGAPRVETGRLESGQAQAFGAAAALRTVHFEPAAIPSGFSDFCRREPAECGRAAPERHMQQGSGLLTAVDYPMPEAAAAQPRVPSIRGEGYDWATAFAAVAAVQAGVVADPGQPTAVAMDEGVLDAVNRDVNARIHMASDEATYGRSDYWTLPIKNGRDVGNCKDYVLEKRRALAAMGVAPGAMSIALVLTPAGEPHAVLLVATAHGVAALDNRSTHLVSWTRAAYTLVERQAFGEPFRWVAPARGAGPQQFARAADPRPPA